MKILGLVAAVLAMALAVCSSAAARTSFTCNGVFTGATYEDVLIPSNGSCTLVNSTVTGNVKVLNRAYFQATGTSIGRSVNGSAAQTIFIDTGSKVAGSINADRTSQVFVYNSRVTGSIHVERSSDAVQICGTTVLKGDISVVRSGRDILVGDPLAEGCPGNSVKRGDVEIKRNLAVVELVVRGNKIAKGDLDVVGNTGPVPKIVANNVGGDRLKCTGNSGPFRASGNTGWERKQGKCAKRPGSAKRRR